MPLLHFVRSIKPRHKTLIGGLVIGTAATMLMLLVLQGLPIFARAELSAYDWQMNRRGHFAPSNQIVIVGLDQNTISDLPPGTNPLRRYWIGQAVKFLCSAHARAIGIDFSYFQRSVHDVYTRGADSRALGAAVRSCGRVVLNLEIEGAGANSNVFGQSLYGPIPEIAPPGKPWVHLGLDNIPVDSDGVVRQAWNLQYVLDNTKRGGFAAYPTFPIVLASVALHEPVAKVLQSVPQNMLTNYVGPQAVDNTSVSWPNELQLSDVVPDPTFGETKPSAPASLFRNKIVLIIPAAIVLADTHSTPFGDMYGGFVQANTLNTILEDNPIIPAGDGINNLVIILIGLLTTLVASRFGIWHSVIATIVLAVGYPVATILAFSQYRYWLHLPTPELTFVVVLAGIMAFRFATEERQKRHAHRKFGQYLKPEIVDIIVNSPGVDTTLEGVRRPLSVLFVDIRGFTAMSERMNPEDVVSLLDIYLEELTESVQVFDGTLDKYVGDELMAVWNAPRLQVDHPMLAVKSALEMVNRLDKINAQLTARHLPNIKYGIGVNTGEGIVGEMGSTFRKQYDAIGDSVNTAARLCSAAGGAEIIIGQTTWELLGDRLEIEETEPLTLKGKSARLRTFRVISIRDTPLVAADVVDVEEKTATPA
jgi:adenylate cyclase